MEASYQIHAVDILFPVGNSPVPLYKRDELLAGQSRWKGKVFVLSPLYVWIFDRLSRTLVTIATEVFGSEYLTKID